MEIKTDKYFEKIKVTFKNNLNKWLINSSEINVNETYFFRMNKVYG